MAKLTWRGWDVRNRQKDRTVLRRTRAGLRCEALETRQLLATRVWIGTADPNWNVAGNWNVLGTGTTGVPQANDTVAFNSSAPGVLKTTNNDLPQADIPLSISFGTSGYTLTGAEVALSGALAIQATNPSGGNEIQLPLLLSNSATITVGTSASLTLDGDVSGGDTATLTKVGAGTLALSGSANAFAGTTSVDAGTLFVDSSLGPIRLNGGTLGGIGTVGAVTATGAGGVVAPGDSPGVLHTGDVALTPATTLNVELAGTAAGTFDQLDVTGAVNLGSAALAVVLEYNPGPNDSFVIVNNDLTDPITGTFAGLPQGSTVTVLAPNGASVQLIVSYSGGDGNDVALSVNGAPVAGNDFYTLPDNATLIVPAPGVLINDTDPNGDPIHPVLISGPTHGTLSLSGDGSLQYDPAPGYSGPDSFTYRASDGRLTSNLATVNLFVNAVNLPPVANADSYSSKENTTLTIPAKGVLANDFSPGGLALTATLLAAPSHGAVTLNPDGSFTYIPTTDFIGTDTFTYRAVDSNQLKSAETSVTLNIGVLNLAPTANDDAFTLTENKSLFVVGPGVLANDTDPNKDSLSAFLVSAPLHGSLTLGGDGSINYTPDANYSGPDSFTYKVSDGQLTSATAATVSLTITHVNQPPVAANDDYTFLEDGGAQTIAAPGVLANDTDPDAGDALTAAVVNGPQHGTVTLNPNGSFTYTPNLHYFGTDSFTYRDTDNGTTNGVAAPLTSNIATVNLTITHVNHAPTVTDDNFTTNGDTALIVAAPGVLANDGDVDTGDILSAVLMTGPTHGTLTLSGDGSFVYTPTAGYSGPDKFTYVASDGKLISPTATVNITVLAVNHAPVATNDVYAGTENTVLTIAAPGVLGNDSDIDGNAITAVLVNGTQHGSVTLNANGSFTYTPSANFNGTDTFTYRALDNGVPPLFSNLATVTLNIALVDTAPVAVDDTFTTNEDVSLSVAAPGVLFNDSDVDSGDVLSAILINGPKHGSVALNSNGSFVYTPDPNFNGIGLAADSFDYRVTDGKKFSNLATVTVNVLPVPDAPVTAPDAFTGLEDQTLTVAGPGLLLNDLNPDNGALTLITLNGPQHGTLVLDVNNDGGFTYKPNLNYNGTDSFSYYLRSGTLNSNVSTVTLTILPVPDAPVAADDAYTTNEDTTFISATSGVLLNDVDVDGNPMLAVLQTGPTHGTLTLNSDGSFAYIPAANYNGPDMFTYRVGDGKLPGNTATVSLTVLAVNDAPVAGNDSFTIPRDQRLVVPAPGILANDSDVEGSTLSTVLVNPPLNGVLALAADGSFVYTPNPIFSGADSFTYRANDGQLTSNLATVSINVTAVPPSTVQLDPASDTGVSSGDRITKDNTPTFFGTTIPNLQVLLFEKPSGSSAAPTVVGRTFADSAGNFTVTSSPLPDGQYDFSVSSIRADGLSTGLVSAGSLIIDTVAPQVLGVVINPKTGQILVTYKDDRGGMSVPSEVDTLNYSFTRRTTSTPRANVITGARALPTVNPTDQQTVILQSADGRRVLHGRYLFSIISGGVSDAAGNALDGEFNGTYPSGNGAAGGNYNALVLNGGFARSSPVPTTEFIPVLTQSPTVSVVHPKGILVHTKKKKGH